MALVKSIEHITLTLAAASTSAETALGEGQTVGNCVPFVSKRVTTAPTVNDNMSETNVHVDFNGSNVRAQTYAGATRAMVVEVYVVEFDPAEANVYSYSTSDTGQTSWTQTLSPTVTLADTFLYYTYTTSTTTAQFIHHNSNAALTATDTVTFARSGTSGETAGTVFVVEATDSAFSVQHESITLSAVTSATATITSITEAKTFLVGNHRGGNGDNVDQSVVNVVLTDDVTITATKPDSTGAVYWEGCAVTLAGAENVYRGGITSTTSGTATDGIGATVDLDKSSVHNAGNCGAHCHGSWSGSGDSNVPDAQIGWDFSNSTNVRATHSTVGSSSPTLASWEVIEWELTGAAAPRRVMVIS